MRTLHTHQASRRLGGDRRSGHSTGNQRAEQDFYQSCPRHPPRRPQKGPYTGPIEKLVSEAQGRAATGKERFRTDRAPSITNIALITPRALPSGRASLGECDSVRAATGRERWFDDPCRGGCVSSTPFRSCLVPVPVPERTPSLSPPWGEGSDRGRKHHRTYPSLRGLRLGVRQKSQHHFCVRANAPDCGSSFRRVWWARVPAWDTESNPWSRRARTR